MGNYARECEFATVIVDDLLDILTKKEHRKTSKTLTEKKVAREEEKNVEAITEEIKKENEEVDFDSLKSLEKDGIDMSFLDNIKQEYVETSAKIKKEQPEDNLEETAKLLLDLKAVQDARLKAPLPQHFSMIAKPSEKEMKLAEQVRSRLAGMAGQLTPGHVVPGDSLKKLLGIPI